MKKQAILTFALILSLSLCACGIQQGNEPDASGATAATGIDTSDLFTDRDLDGSYNEGGSAYIRLDGDSASCESSAVKISGSTVTITDEGTYILSGELNNGMVIVNARKEDKVQLVLNGVNISSSTCAPIYVLQADKVFLTLAEGTANTLSNGGEFVSVDENNIDSVIFSKEDLTLNGSGWLTVTSPAGHGIVSKDELTVTGGSYTIQTASHGLSGKDNVCIHNGILEITAGKDGIQADNDEDTALGFVYIAGGSFTINAEGDGISASSNMQIDGGTFSITAGGGSVNGNKQSSNSWGGFMGGSPGGFGNSSASNEDSTSMKGIKSGANLQINGGSFSIDSADDSVHADASVTVTAGAFEITSGDDAFHAEETLTITGSTINITECYEGLEALHLKVQGGDIRLVASDDGLNAAGGTDGSGGGGRDGKFGGGGPGGRPGGMGGGMSSSSDGSIEISGGTLYINSSGDGIDANGTLTISGGHTTVVGPTQGDTATLDYDVSGIITGGTFIGTGASGMAQTFSDSEQGVIAVSVGAQSAGTQITLTDSKGNVVISYTPELNFAVVILSAPHIIKGENYTITVGAASGTFEAS